MIKVSLTSQPDYHYKTASSVLVNVHLLINSSLSTVLIMNKVLTIIVLNILFANKDVYSKIKIVTQHYQAVHYLQSHKYSQNNARHSAFIALSIAISKILKSRQTAFLNTIYAKRTA